MVIFYPKEKHEYSTSVLASEEKTVDGMSYKYGAAVNETVLISAANSATERSRIRINSNDDM